MMKNSIIIEDAFGSLKELKEETEIELRLNNQTYLIKIEEPFKIILGIHFLESLASYLITSEYIELNGERNKRIRLSEGQIFDLSYGR